MVEKRVSELTCQARFGSIKEDIKEIKTSVGKIKNNHLSHIEKDINEIKAYIVLQEETAKLEKEAAKNKRDWGRWAIPLLISVLFTIIQILIKKGFI